MTICNPSLYLPLYASATVTAAAGAYIFIAV
jgi:hypothetical protein